MKIRIRYDTSFQTVEVTEAECESMIRADYAERLAKADDPSTVQSRSMQEIMDERFNKAEHSNYKKEHRHTYSIDSCGYESEDFLDYDSVFTSNIEQEELLHALAAALEELQPQQRDLIRRVFFEGESLASIAAEDGVLRSSVHHRLTKIFAVLQKKLKNF